MSPHGTGILDHVVQWPIRRMDTRPWGCEPLDFSLMEVNKEEERKELLILFPKGIFLNVKWKNSQFSKV